MHAIRVGCTQLECVLRTHEGASHAPRIMMKGPCPTPYFIHFSPRNTKGLQIITHTSKIY